MTSLLLINYSLIWVNYSVSLFIVSTIWVFKFSCTIEYYSLSTNISYIHSIKATVYFITITVCMITIAVCMIKVIVYLIVFIPCMIIVIVGFIIVCTWYEVSFRNLLVAKIGSVYSTN